MDCNTVLQALLSFGFSWQKYWSGLPFPPSRDLSCHTNLLKSFLLFAKLSSNATSFMKTSLNILELKRFWWHSPPMVRFYASLILFSILICICLQPNSNPGFMFLLCNLDIIAYVLKVFIIQTIKWERGR